MSSTMKIKQKKFIIIAIALLIVAAAGVSTIILKTANWNLVPGEQHASSSPFSPVINEQFKSEIPNTASNANS